MRSSRRSTLPLLSLLLTFPSLPVSANETCRLWFSDPRSSRESEPMDCALARFEAARQSAFVIDAEGRIIGVGKPRFFARAGGASRDVVESEPLLAWEEPPLEELDAASVELPSGAAPLVLREIRFVDESDRIASSSASAVRRLSTILREDPGSVFEIGVHSDRHGDPRYDELVTQMQAESLRDALVERGVPRESLQVRGYGSSRPLASGGSEEGQRLNRRVELRRLEPAAADASR